MLHAVTYCSLSKHFRKLLSNAVHDAQIAVAFSLSLNDVSQLEEHMAHERLANNPSSLSDEDACPYSSWFW